MGGIAMIEESYVSFDTAKMLKDTGFEAECSFIVDDDGNKLYRPSQALAARWLREVHHLNVYACFDYVCFDDGKRKWFFMRENTMINDYTSVYCSIISYDSYEQALEAGLQEAIKLIKK